MKRYEKGPSEQTKHSLALEKLQSGSQLTEDELKERKLTHFSVDFLQNKEQILQFEVAVGTRLEKMSTNAQEPHLFYSQNYWFRSSLRNIFTRIAENIFNGSSRVLAREYLTRIRDGLDPKQALGYTKQQYQEYKQRVKESPSIPYSILVDADVIMGLEQSLGLSLEEVDIKDDRYFIYNCKGEKYRDSLRNIFSRVAHEITGVQGESRLLAREFLISVRNGTSVNDAIESIRLRYQSHKEVRERKVPVELLSTPDAILALERSARLVFHDSLACDQLTDRIAIRLLGCEYRDSIRNIVGRISSRVLNLKRPSYALARDYLILVRDGLSLQAAKDKILEKQSQKEQTPIEDLLTTPEAIREFESNIGLSLDGLNVSDQQTQLTFCVSGKVFTDRIRNIMNRIGIRLFGSAGKYAPARDFLIAVRNGMSIQDATTFIREQYSIKLFPIELLVSQEKVRSLERVFSVRFGEDISAERLNKREAFVIDGTTYEDSLRNICERVGILIKGKGKTGWYSIAFDYLALIREGHSQEQAMELLRMRRGEGKVPLNLLSDSSAIKAIEVGIGVSVEELAISERHLSNRSTNFEIQGKVFVDTPKNLLLRICHHLAKGNRSLAAARDYLLYIKNGFSQEAARLLVMNKYEQMKKKRQQTLENQLVTPEAIRALEITLGSTLENMKFGDANTFFTITVSDVVYHDTPKRLAARLSRQVTGGKDTGVIVGRDYLILIRDGNSPERARQIVLQKFEQRRSEQNSRTRLTDFVAGLSDKLSADAEKFNKLIGLFGSSRAIDILYQFRPEFRGISVEYVKSTLADYLGDFLVQRASFQLENLKFATEYLAEKELQSGLFEVIKRDCLAWYHREKRASPETEDREIFSTYFTKLTVSVADLHSEELQTVIKGVESYYQSLLTDFSKPSHVIDSLRVGRNFPDINQLVNMKALLDKRIMLFADQMGLGKSAPPILFKEQFCREKPAIVIVPSGVLDTWSGYLSDAVDEHGKQVGYFKSGKQPKVLIVDSLDSLQKGVLSQFDYILVSHERLTDEYVSALESIESSMVIVDEIHKLKNIREGTRAQHLLRLTAKAEKDNSYLALLSGTPVPNKIEDIAISLKLLYPERFRQMDNQTLVRQIIYGDLVDLRSLLLPHMEMKSLEEGIEIPVLTEKTVRLQLSPQEQLIYEALLEEDELTALQKLGVLRRFGLTKKSYHPTPNVDGTKERAVGAYLQTIFIHKQKILMFVNDYIEGVIRGDNSIVDTLGLSPEIEVLTIEGEVGQGERTSLQNRFNNSDRKTLLIVSGQTVDVGIDLSAADEVLFYNLPWSKFRKDQQLGRVYREGLSHPLTCTTFVLEGTIEQGIEEYIAAKAKAVEKLLYGIPTTELERSLLANDETQQDLSVSPELAEYYFSAWDKLMRIFGYVKEIGEQDFHVFLERFGKEYADCYLDLGSRSYQSNASRLCGSIIARLIEEDGRRGKEMILDIASGPEMLRKHVPDGYDESIVSVDINRYHFQEAGGKRVVGSFVSLPFAEESVDYMNCSLALHYTKFIPSKGQYERLETLMEINRVLRKGGKAVLNMIYSLDMKDLEKFQQIIKTLGFRIVPEYSGVAESEGKYRSRLIILEKEWDFREGDVAVVAEMIGKENLDGLKLRETGAKVKDSRRIMESCYLNGSEIPIRLNGNDRLVLIHEQNVVHEGESLISKYGSIEAIPSEKVVEHHFVRIYNGKRYVLFKSLPKESGVVVLR